MMLLTRILWSKSSDRDNPVEITKFVSISATKSKEIKNNLLTIELANPLIKKDDDGNIIGYFISSGDGIIEITEDDEFTVWAEYSDDPSKYGSSWWSDNNLIGKYIVKENGVSFNYKQNTLKISSVDSAYVLFNQSYSFSYGIINKYTASGVIREICRKFSEETFNKLSSYSGTHYDTGVKYIIDAKFVSEGGYITDYRSDISTTLSGSISETDSTITVNSTTGFKSSGTIVIGSEHISYTGLTSTSFTGCSRGIDNTKNATHSSGDNVYQGFPLIVFSKRLTPLFEWVSDISQVEMVNYIDEVATTGILYYGRAFVFFIDKNNKAHWSFPSSTINHTISSGNKGYYSFNFKKKVFDSINHVEFNCGSDMEGNGITYYLFDESADSSTLKTRNQPMTSISTTLVKEDIDKNPSRDTSREDVLKQYPSSYPMTPSFLEDANNFRRRIGASPVSNVTSDSEYNQRLREASRWRGLINARKIITQRSGFRYKGSFASRGKLFAPADYIKLNVKEIGLNDVYVRINNVRFHINSKQGFETIVECEEDVKLQT